MDVLPSLISEEEVLNMNSEQLRSFLLVCSPSSFSYIRSYINNPQADARCVAVLQDVAGDILTARTFHLDVREREIQNLIMKYGFKSLPEYMDDNILNVIIKQLSWLEENMSKMRDTIPPRTFGMYTEAYNNMVEFCNTQEHTHNIPMLMKKYKKDLFCPVAEKPVSTGLGGLIRNSNEWRMMLKGAQYLKYCHDNGISQFIAREV